MFGDDASKARNFSTGVSARKAGVLSEKTGEGWGVAGLPARSFAAIPVVTLAA
jgi:hypothetical protein